MSPLLSHQAPLCKLSCEPSCHCVTSPVLQNHHLIVTSPLWHRQHYPLCRKPCFRLFLAPYHILPSLHCCALDFIFVVMLLLFFSINVEIKCGLGFGCFGFLFFFFWYWLKFGWQLLCWWGLEGRGRGGETEEGRGWKGRKSRKKF